MNKATASIVGLSMATGEDLAESATVVAGILNAFNLDASESARVADIMASSFSSSALDLNKFKDGMSKFAPVAEQLNWSIEQTTSYLAVLADANIDAGTASAQLRNVMLILNQDGITLEEALTKLSGSTNLLADANEMFGKRAAPVVAVLAENIEKAKELEQTFKDASGSAEDMASAMSDTLYGDMKKAESSVEGLKISIGESENDGLRGIVQGFTSVIDKISADGTIIEIFDALKKPVADIRKSFKPLVALFSKAGVEVDALSIFLKVLTFVFNTFGLGVKLIAGLLSTAIDTLVGFYNIFSDIKNAKFEDIFTIIKNAIVNIVSPITDLIGLTDDLNEMLGLASKTASKTTENIDELMKIMSDPLGSGKKFVEEQKEAAKTAEDLAKKIEKEKEELEDANKRYQTYLDAITKANEEAKLQIELGENSLEVRAKELDAIYAATKAYVELNGYTAEEIEQLKSLRTEINKLNTEIANAPKLIDKQDVKNIEVAAKNTGEISMNMRNTSPAIAESVEQFSKLEKISAKLRNAFNDFFGTKPIEDWRDTFKESISQVVSESLDLFNEIIAMQNNQL